MNNNCSTTNTPNNPCTTCDNACPITLNDFCIYYTGEDNSSLGIYTNDKLSVVLGKFIDKLSESPAIQFTPLDCNSGNFTDSTSPEQPFQYTVTDDGWVTIRGRLVVNTQINTSSVKNVISNATSNLLPASITPVYSQNIMDLTSAGVVYNLKVFNTGYLKLTAVSGNIIVNSIVYINIRYNIH